MKKKKKEEITGKMIIYGFPSDIRITGNSCLPYQIAEFLYMIREKRERVKM